jgi:hypothetical protein
MRFSHISLIAVMLVVIAVAIAGCSGNSGAQPIVKSTQAAGSSSGSSTSGTSSSGSSSGSSGSSSSSVSGADLFGGLNYNWVEYKIDAGSGMTMYIKQNKLTGKCSTRFEGAAAANLPADMNGKEYDCKGGSGSSSSPSVPDAPPSDAKVDCSLLDESVTVPAGTFSATKCTVTSQGHTSTTWIVKNKFMVKMESSTDAGAMNMVLNAYG